MTTLHHVKKARKTIRGTGVKKGGPYWWWRFRVNGRGSVKHVSTVRPRRSQLTRSPFLQVLYEAEDRLLDATNVFVSSGGGLDGLITAINDAAETVREERVTCGEKLCNTPEPLKEAPTGVLLAEREEACERIADELENAAADIESLALPEGQDERDNWMAEIETLVSSVDWSLP